MRRDLAAENFNLQEREYLRGVDLEEERLVTASELADAQRALSDALYRQDRERQRAREQAEDQERQLLHLTRSLDQERSCVATLRRELREAVSVSSAPVDNTLTSKLQHDLQELTGELAAARADAEAGAIGRHRRGCGRAAELEHRGAAALPTARRGAGGCGYEWSSRCLGAFFRSSSRASSS